jgi:hypothetical protein
VPQVRRLNLGLGVAFFIGGWVTLSLRLLILFVGAAALGGHDFSRAEKVEESTGLQPLKKGFLPSSIFQFCFFLT